jgi:alkylhydroperoxidase family enzyme
VPRIHPVEPSEATPEVKALYQQLTASLGIEPNNFFKTMGRNPELLKPLIDFSEVTLEKGKLERRLKEWVILQIGRLHNCDYVYEAHKQALSRALMSEVLDDRRKPLDTSSFADRDKLAIRYAGLITTNSVDDEIFAELRQAFSEEEIIELTVLAAYYTFICRVVNAFGIEFDEIQFLEPQNRS